jgi:predicted transglutaminase-like cysteine proteinase
MRGAIQGLVAASVVLAISVQYKADAALNAGLQLPPARIDPLGLTLLKPDLSGPAETARFYPYGDLFAAAPALPDTLLKPARSDAAAVSVLANAPAASEVPATRDVLAKLDPGISVPAMPQADAAPGWQSSEPIVRRQTVPESQLRASIPDYEPEVAMPRPADGAKGHAAVRKHTAHERGAGPKRRVARIAFGAPALAPMAHTSFCMTYPADCKVQKVLFRGGALELTSERRVELTRVNAEVNQAIRPQRMNESVAGEKWLIAPAVGDCNDYAVTKRHELLARGWPARDLLLAEVVVPWGEHHLVLVVRTEDGDLVADNLHKVIRAWDKTGYQWVRVQSPANPTFWSAVKAPEPDLVAMASQGARL